MNIREFKRKTYFKDLNGKEFKSKDIIERLECKGI